MNKNLEEADEVGLLDMLIVVAENFKLLVAGSLLAGALAAGLAQMAPKSYVSEAILAPPTQSQLPNAAQAVVTVPTPLQTASLMTSARILDPVVLRLKLAEGQSVDEARRGLAKQVKATADQDGLLHLHVTAPNGEKAQALASAIINSWIESTSPTPAEREQLERRLKYAESSLGATRRLIERLSAETGKFATNRTEQGDEAASLVAAAELQMRYLKETAEIARLLNGNHEEVVKQAPTLPTTPASMHVGLIALLSSIAMAFALLLWIFIVQAWKGAKQDPQVAPKVARLRAALGLK
ncbi:MAG: Wzz/FepE/Etk N-terminal domain-containing protein [Hydrogenophaga sp.]